MKNLIILFTLIYGTVYASTCTTTSRTNYSTNQVLTSSALNSDFNQLVAKANSFDGGCITAGTIEYDNLNSTQFTPLLKGIKEGCKVSYSSASTISVGKCLTSVNGNFVYTTSANTATFGCTSCSAEVASTQYYVYIQTGSSGTTLTPLILTTAPNEDGYDNSGNKVLARFVNNAASDIDQYSIQQWHVNDFIDPPRMAGASYWAGTASCSSWTRTSTTVGAFSSDTDCPAPTIEFSRMGTWATTDADLPRQTVNALPPGNYRAKFMFRHTVAGGGYDVFAINDGTTTCRAVPGSNTSSYTYASVECIFTYASIGNRVFELYTASDSGAVTIDNAQVTPAVAIKFSLEYLGNY